MAAGLGGRAPAARHLENVIFPADSVIGLQYSATTGNRDRPRERATPQVYYPAGEIPPCVLILLLLLRRQPLPLLQAAQTPPTSPARAARRSIRSCRSGPTS